MLKIVSKGNFESITEFSLLQDRKLGSGSFGTVKLAIHNATARMYALKIISLNDLPSQSEIKLVEREIKLHSEVDHPYIIKVWDTFNDDEHIYIVMEYAQMGNLFYYQNTKQTFSQPEAFKFFSQTLSALRYLHSNDIIHRDLKPQNILLDQYLNVKICDFGWCAQNIHMKRATFCGTYEYMAPQMIFRSEYDYRIDIWALGILLYELLHGNAPFKGKTIEQVQQSMLRGTYELDPQLSDAAKDLISKILQFKAQQRLSIEQIATHSWMQKTQYIVKQYLKEERVKLPHQIPAKIQKLPISFIKLQQLKEKSKKVTQKKQQDNFIMQTAVNERKKSRNMHRKNNSMNLDQDLHNKININLSINTFSIVNGKNCNKKSQLQSQGQNYSKNTNNKVSGLDKEAKKKQIYHSQQKITETQTSTNDNFSEFRQFKEMLKKRKNFSKDHKNSSSQIKLLKSGKKDNEGRCKTLADQIETGQPIQLRKFEENLTSQGPRISPYSKKSKMFQKKPSKQSLLQNMNFIPKGDLNSVIMKKNLKLRKSQDKISDFSSNKNIVRYNTEAYDNQDGDYDNFLLNFSKNQNNSTKIKKTLTVNPKKSTQGKVGPRPCPKKTSKPQQ